MLSTTGHHHDYARAVALKAASVVLFALMAVCIKLLDGGYSLIQLVFARSFFALFPLIPFILAAGGLAALKTDRPLAHATRGLVGVCAMCCAFYALTHLPLATATALSFTIPLFVSVLAVLWLGESMPLLRVFAVALGFAGTLLVLRPETAGFSPTMLVALGAALLSAIGMVLVRQLTSTEHSITVVFYFSAFAALLSGAALPFFFTMPTLHDAILLIGAGLIGGLAQVLLTQASRHAPISQVAPFEYTNLLWSLLFGFLLWQEVPTWLTLGGAGIIILSGLLVLRR